MILDRFLIGILDGVQGQVLVDLQALLALVPGDQLDLRVGQALCRQVGQHLVPEQVGVDVLGDARPVAVRLHDLLHAARREGRAALGLEQVAVLRVGLEVAAEHQAEALGEQDVAVLAALALVDEDLALLSVHVLDADADQLADAHGREEEQLEHDLVLEVATLLDDPEEALEVGLGQELGKLALLLGLAQAELPPRLLADVEEVGVAEPLLAGDADDLGDDVLISPFRSALRNHSAFPPSLPRDRLLTAADISPFPNSAK